ncbi:MAG: hemolysin family protein [Spirochaetes bacterium]|nr:hemolysin family protein [Spirochaetota bacterium]
MYVVYEIGIFIFILLSFFFSSFETAIISANPIRLQALAEKGSFRAKRALALIHQREELISLTLIGNNIANLGSTAFIMFVVSKHIVLTDYAVFVVTAIQTIFFLIMCEIFPKVVARNKPETMLMIYILPLYMVRILFYPFMVISASFTEILKKVFRFNSSNSSLIRSRDEIEMLFSIGNKEGIIRKKHQEFIDEIMSLHSITAKEIMTPIIDVVSVEKNEPIRKVVLLIGETRFSRIPVYEGRVDNIIGYVYYRDLLERKDIRRITDVLRKPYFIPSTKKVDELFFEMQEKDERMLFVVNEFGGVEGLVTTEDIVEEVVGEIQTRDHPKPDLIQQLHKRTYLVRGDIDIEYFQKKFGMHIEKEGFETLAGFITAHLGRIPAKGEVFRVNEYRFKVNEGNEKVVESVIVTVPSGKKIL